VVGPIAVQSALDGTRRHVQRTTTCRRFDRLEVQTVDAPGSYEGLDFGDDLCVEDRFEPPFLAASFSETASGSSSKASHKRSLVSTSSRARRRKRRYSAICSRVLSTALNGMTRVFVFPATSRVSDQWGP